jgi:dihydroxyacetone kinase-like predicted kinase
MSSANPPNRLTGLRAELLELAGMATAALEGVSAQLDAINVWPVADEDTGRNLTRTLRAITDNAAEIVDPTADDVVDDLERALRGARGNSGTILAAMIGGATRSVLASPRVDGHVVAAAVHAAAHAAYEAVPRPVEGTMLTVARALLMPRKCRHKPVRGRLRS